MRTRNINPWHERDGSRLVDYAILRGCKARRGKGDHVILTNERGSACVPDRVLGTGLHRAILRSFVAMGILCTVAVVLAVFAARLT